MKFLNAPQCPTLILIFSLLSTSLTFAGREAGNGADTFVSQMQEARDLAVAALSDHPRLQTVNEKLRNVYSARRSDWIKALKASTFVARNYELFDHNDSSSGPRAALALPNKKPVGSVVYLSQPYWGRQSISLIQSVVLAIHEAGHLAQIPLSHEELDQVGEAIKQEKLGEFFGTEGLRKITQENPNLSRFEVLKRFFKQAPEAATIADLRDDTLFVYSTLRCVLSNSGEDFGYGQDTVNYRFATEVKEGFSHGPLFGSQDKVEVLILPLDINQTSALLRAPRELTYSTERRGRDFVVKGIYDISLDRTPFYAKTIFSFRKSGDTVAFSLATEKTLNNPSYGYCWRVTSN